jgi:hypothetical protein
MEDSSPGSANTQASPLHDEHERALRSICNSWFTTVIERKYSAGNFTVPLDKLPALSGLAAVFHHRLGGQYMAGHWEFRFLDYLYWETGTWTSERVKNEYTAPTWSWASTSGPVRFQTANYTPLVELVSSDIQLATSNPFGAVQRGSSIRLRGPVIVPKGFPKPMSWGYHVRFFFDGRRGGPISQRIKDVGDISTVAGAARWNNATQRILLILSRENRHHGRTHGVYRVMGLLLEKIPNCNDHRYYRIGCFQIIMPRENSTAHKVSLFKKSYLSKIPHTEVTIL